MDGGITRDDLRNAPDLEALTARAAAKGMTPGWIPRKTPILWHAPRTGFKATQWLWADAKAAMDGAARLIGTDLAERRNLVMRNPAEGNDIATLRTLICAYQTILPGESARSHRHAPHAFRVILDSRGAWSVVNGEKHPMETGDIVLTPGWSWHGHGHDGTEQAYWFDGLDVPLTHLLEPMFVEEHPAGMEPIERVTPDSPFRFTWAQTRRRLDEAAEDPDGFFGRRIAIDTSTMPTLSIQVMAWKAGFESRPYRAAMNQVFVVMQGSGSTTIGNGKDGDKSIRWSFGDTFTAPLWHSIVHKASDDAVIMCMSDEALMRWTKYYRFEALA